MALVVAAVGQEEAAAAAAAAAGQEEAAEGLEEAAPAPAARSSAASVRAPPPAWAPGRQPREDRTATATPRRVVARAGLASGGWPVPAPPSPPRRSPVSDSDRRAFWRRNPGSTGGLVALVGLVIAVADRWRHV